MEKTFEKFIKYQEESEARFLRHEEERSENEREVEDRRRKEEREHETRMMGMIANLFRPTQQYAPRQDFEEYYP